ncbi:MAG: hypothetical protein ACTSPW_14180 [Promethearchaeota archaeon]
MSQNPLLSFENIKSLMISLNIKTPVIKIKDFFQNVNLDGFKYVNEINLKNINKDNCKITLFGEDLNNNYEENISGPTFIINLRNNIFEFIGPPPYIETSYDNIIEKINTESNFIFMNFYKIYSEFLNFDIDIRILFEINEKEICEKINLFYEDLNSKYKRFDTINGKLEGITINLSKDNCYCNAEITKKIKDFEELKFVYVIILDIIDGDKKIKLCDFEIKKYLIDLIIGFNNKLNKLIG